MTRQGALPGFEPETIHERRPAPTQTLIPGFLDCAARTQVATDDLDTFQAAPLFTQEQDAKAREEERRARQAQRSIEQ